MGKQIDAPPCKKYSELTQDEKDMLLAYENKVALICGWDTTSITPKSVARKYGTCNIPIFFIESMRMVVKYS